MLADLARAGFRPETLDDLRHGGRDYRSVVPILTKWLVAIDNPDVKESIVRLLAAPFVKEAAPALIAEFRRAPSDQAALKWTIGTA